jgi:hypothetical protein
VLSLPLGYSGAICMVKYNLMHFFTPIGLLLNYRIFVAYPSSWMHARSVTANAVKPRRRKRMLTKYTVYDFQPLSKGGHPSVNDARAVQQFSMDPRPKSHRQGPAPDAEAALITFTMLHAWEIDASPAREGSMPAPLSNADSRPFLSSHTVSRLGMSQEQADAVRSPSRPPSPAGPRSPIRSAVPGSPLKLGGSLPFGPAGDGSAAFSHPSPLLASLEPLGKAVEPLAVFGSPEAGTGHTQKRPRRSAKNEGSTGTS